MEIRFSIQALQVLTGSNILWHLADFTRRELSLIHISIKLVKSKVTDINRMKIEEQKKAVRSGYDIDIIPSDLNTYGGEAKRLLEDLQSRNERMFLVTVVF